MTANGLMVRDMDKAGKDTAMEMNIKESLDLGLEQVNTLSDLFCYRLLYLFVSFLFFYSSILIRVGCLQKYRWQHLLWTI